MAWQALLDVQQYCKVKSASAGNTMKKAYDDIQFYLLKKSLSSRSLPLPMKQSVSEELKTLQHQSFQKPEDILASFDETYPGVWKKNHQNVSWDEVILEETLKSELEDVASIALDFYNVKPFGSALGRMKAILLLGVPGTGKTKSARAMASQTTNPKVFEISAAQVCQSYYGESEKFLAELFKVLRCTIPSILFIEEVDSIGR